MTKRKIFSSAESSIWNVCPECGEWWNVNEELCPECKEDGKTIKLIPTCAICGNPVEKCKCNNGKKVNIAP